MNNGGRSAYERPHVVTAAKIPILTTMEARWPFAQL